MQTWFVATYSTDHLIRYCTKFELARALSCDFRNIPDSRLRPVGLLVTGRTTSPLYEWPHDHLMSCVAVNSNSNLQADAK